MQSLERRSQCFTKVRSSCYPSCHLAEGRAHSRLPITAVCSTGLEPLSLGLILGVPAPPEFISQAPPGQPEATGFTLARQAAPEVA